MTQGTTLEPVIKRHLAHALVEDMADGGMGSVRFCRQGPSQRSFGRQAAEASFLDSDGVPVSATLNLDQDGALFELDLWKADNSALRHYPSAAAINIVADPG